MTEVRHVRAALAASPAVRDVRRGPPPPRLGGLGRRDRRPPLWRRVALMAGAWTFLGAVVGTVGPGGTWEGSGRLAFAAAGVIVLCPAGVALGLIGGGVRGTVLGALAGLIAVWTVGTPGPGAGLLTGALLGATLGGYLRLLRSVSVLVSAAATGGRLVRIPETQCSMTDD